MFLLKPLAHCLKTIFRSLKNQKFTSTHISENSAAISVIYNKSKYIKEYKWSRMLRYKELFSFIVKIMHNSNGTETLALYY